VKQEENKLNEVQTAYIKLKQECYYDTVDLFLRQRIANFECANDFKDRLIAVASFLETLDSEENDLENNEQFNEWLDTINFYCLPKGIRSENSTTENSNTPRFITNFRSSNQYEVEEVNYFINAPIELQIIDVLWCMNVGAWLDQQLIDNCLGNRIIFSDNDSSSGSSGLFKIFHRQYSKWRDTAIRKAEKALENGTDILLIGLDIQQCYYHMAIDWDRLNKEARGEKDHRLNHALKLIFNKYAACIYDSLKTTHESAKDIQGLPIGLSSSRVLCNWLLNDFDRKVQDKLHPLYYGRYVDDILIVIQKTLASGLSSNEVIDKVLVQEKVINKDEKNNYSISGSPSLKIQQSKFIIQYFDHKHSHAGLKEFKREIEAQASEFRFLPDRDGEIGLDNCAFDLIYKGSINKLRSVIGLEANSTELSKYLSRKIMLYRLCQEGGKEDHIEQLFRFYKGKNIFDFYRLWEKVFSLFIVNEKESDSYKFYSQCKDTIKKLQYKTSLDTEKKVKNDLDLYLLLSLAIPFGLKGDDYRDALKNKRFGQLIRGDENGNSLLQYSKNFRDANLIRHQFVAWPLLNYTSYQGDLSSATLFLSELKIDDWSIKEKVECSPRYIHLDEYQLFNLLACVSQGNKIALDVLLSGMEANGLNHLTKFAPEENGDVCLPDEYKINNQSDEQVCVIGIANMKVKQADIEAAYTPHKKPNLSITRQADLYELLNSAIRGKECDILVLPEVSIPVRWLPLMVSFARKQQMSIVFGLEHWVSNNKAHNFVVTLLPFETEGGYKNCILSVRLKNHYSPSEKHELNRLDLQIVEPKPQHYEIFTWRGLNFSVYNCFELSDIVHRGVMKSKIDMLIAIAWNRDTPYYSNIIESVVRDLHCYVIHVNTSQYGESRVSAPKSSIEIDMVKVKGGINTAILKAKLDISQIRDFQSKTYTTEDKRYKPTPAGYSVEQARNRACSNQNNSICIKVVNANK